MLSYSHEYEDVVDVIAREEGHTQLDVSVSVDSSPTSTVSSVLSEAEETSPRTDAHTYDSPMQMKRNEAYRLYRTVDGREYVRRHAYCNDVTVPVTNPLNSLYAQTEQSSNLE